MTPENGGYMVAAYVLAAAICVGYAMILAWRIRKLQRRAQ